MNIKKIAYLIFFMFLQSTVSGFSAQRLNNDWQILLDFFQKYGIDYLQYEANYNNPYKNMIATIKQGDFLSQEEQTFINNRMPLIKKSLSLFLDDQTIEPFNIGYCAPGGGYRALILTCGFLKALEDVGLFDGLLYTAALSGSTWFMIPWIFSGKTINQFRQTLITKIKNNSMNPATEIFNDSGTLSTDYLANLVDTLWPKFLFNQQLSSVDIYGSLLEYVLLPEDQRTLSITDQWPLIKNGTHPFPLYTATSLYEDDNDNQNYYWNEFNPLEITNLDLNLKLESYSFGSEFDKGKSKLIAPLQSLGYLMGTFGSAYLVDLIDITRILTDLRNEAQALGYEDAARYLIIATLINLIDLVPLTIREMRICPSMTNNPFKQTHYQELPACYKVDKKLMFADGGIAYNIPGRPLLRPSRKIKVIIIGDSSGDSQIPHEIPDELNKLFIDAHAMYGYTYTRVDDKSTQTLRIFKDLEHCQAPSIIYVNFIKDEKLMQRAQHDPALKKIIDENDLEQFNYDCTDFEAYCNTFNFQYSEQEFRQLSGIAEFNMKVNIETIRSFLKEESKKH